MNQTFVEKLPPHLCPSFGLLHRKLINSHLWSLLWQDKTGRLRWNMKTMNAVHFQVSLFYLCTRRSLYIRLVIEKKIECSCKQAWKRHFAHSGWDSIPPLSLETSLFTSFLTHNQGRKTRGNLNVMAGA